MRLKRILDLVASLLGLLFGAPIWMSVALLVKLSSPGPILHRAVRVGRNGEPFVVFKFRTMRVSDEPHPGVTAAGDPRVTAIGRILRRTKVDELPQLLNVLKGDMSLVGPRPEDPRFLDPLSDAQREVLTARPGITGPSSIAFRNEERLLAAHLGQEERFYREEIAPAKLALDLEYVRSRSFWGDIKLLLRTARAILSSADPPRGS